MGCSRETILSVLEKLAPTRLAESWDNVGLLLDPTGRSTFERALVTIDLTDAVLDEALRLGADLIVAYHPPIFSGLKRLRYAEAKERVVLRAICEKLTIYSPHTALDAVAGGMSDWLAGALGPGQVEPIVANASDPKAGAGRFVQLDQPLGIEQAAALIKAHLGLSQLRVGAPSQAFSIKTMAVCPGAGGAIFERLGAVDLLLTGEMRHHDVLERVACGSYVILTEHTNSERGYLPQLAKELATACTGLAVFVAEADADPLTVI